MFKKRMKSFLILKRNISLTLALTLMVHLRLLDSKDSTVMGWMISLLNLPVDKEEDMVGLEGVKAFQDSVTSDNVKYTFENIVIEIH